MAGLKVMVPALFMIGERNAGLAIPGVQKIIKAMSALVPDPRAIARVAGTGHWLPQERADVVNARPIDFLGTL